MTELEKANKTIEELLRINEELAGTNGQKEAIREIVLHDEGWEDR